MQRIAICASGPSLTADDCALVSDAGIPLIAVNSSWQAAPQCRYIYAGDLCWWDKNYADITSQAELWTCNRRASTRYGIKLFPTDTSVTFNSGQRAILFADWLGYSQIILLGFDCSIANGSHWHGQHDGLSNPTPANTRRWREEFKLAARQLAGRVQIINCSRQTALTCFPVDTLDNLIHG